MRPSCPFPALACGLSGLLVLSACQRPPPPDVVSVRDQAAAAQRLRADVRFLASDALQGRQTGMPGYHRAAEYVARRFATLGLQPAGDRGGWFQSVPLLRATRRADGARLAIRRNGRLRELRLRTQFLPGLDYNAADAAVEAPAVFVAQAVYAPALQQDDFAGLDLKGRIAVLFSGAPARFDPDRRALYAASTDKLRVLAARGAVGVVFVNTVNDEAQVPWARTAANWQRPGLRLRAANGAAVDTFPALRVIATVNASAAEDIFEGSGRSAAQLFRAAQDGTLRGFALPGTLVLAARTRIAPLQARNVVGRLPGAAPALAREQVAYSAHLDGLGLGAALPADAARADRVYNGALDNALGVSILLETARTLRAGAAPKRSLLFVATAAEEQGLLGAQWFATRAPAALVANLNLDMPLLLAPSSDVVAIGIEHSSLRAPSQQAARGSGVALAPDPFPAELAFVRSDQYAFARAGIPALALDAGTSATASSDPKLAQRDFMRRCYHQPCDDATWSIQYGDAARLARFSARLGVLVANGNRRPRWNAGDFFGTRFRRRAQSPP